MNKIKEKLLVIKIRKGDQQAFKEIYKILVDRIYRFIFYRSPDKQTSQDLVQEVFLRLWNYASDSSKQVTNFQALAYKIARNVVSEYYRDRQDTITLEEVNYKLSDDKDLDQEIDIKLHIRQIKQKLSQLKNQEYMEVIELKYLDGLSHKEIAKILDKSEGSVRQILSRGLRKLKEMS